MLTPFPLSLLWMLLSTCFHWNICEQVRGAACAGVTLHPSHPSPCIGTLTYMVFINELPYPLTPVDSASQRSLTGDKKEGGGKGSGGVHASGSFLAGCPCSHFYMILSFQVPITNLSIFLSSSGTALFFYGFLIHCLHLHKQSLY